MERPNVRSILCVDDEQIPLFLRKRVLEKYGFEVVPAGSAREALELLEIRHFDLVLSDHLMPEMTGAQLARIVKERTPQTCVILISGVNEVPSDVTHADLFLSKLEGPVALFEKISGLLNNRQTQAKHRGRYGT